MRRIALLGALVLMSCDDPVSIGRAAAIEGEWVVALDIENFNIGERCRAAGHVIVRAIDPGEIRVRDANGHDCNVAASELSGVAVSDTGGVSGFTIRSENCTLHGQFVHDDSLSGGIDCTIPYPRSGTWAAGRAGEPASLAVTPDAREVAYSARVVLRAIVRDEDGRILYGRRPTWSAPIGVGVILSTDDVDDGEIAVFARSGGTQTITAAYHGMTATSSLTVSTIALVEITAGMNFACGLTTAGHAWCWGNNFDGQLGDGSTTPALGPVRVAGGIQFSAMDAGDGHVCGLSGDSIYCWGANSRGQLGLGDTIRRTTPTRVIGSGWTQVSAGSQHSCAADGEQKGWCWGANFSAQLGTLGSSDRREPTALHSQPAGFARMYAGGWHSCALTASGIGYCWGYGNGTGVIGTGLGPGDSIPRAIAGGHTWRELSPGDERMCGVTTSNAAYCWGLRRWGQNLPGDSVLHSPELVVQGRSFSRVSTYGEHGCGLDEADGAAWCWGHYSDGQLGNGVPVNPPEGGPVAVATHLRFTRIAVGTRFSCGITTSGHTYCWGNNDVGQLGDGTTQGRMLPVRVLGRP